MIPLRNIKADPGPFPDDTLTLFYSLEIEGVAAVCTVGSESGVLWLTGAEAGQPAHLKGLHGFFVPGCEIEADTESLVLHGEAIPTLSILKTENSTAIRTQTSTGATRIYTVAGKPFGSPTNFAAFSLWRAVVINGQARNTALVVGQPLVGS